VESTSGAAAWVFFREKAWEAALKGDAHFGAGNRGELVRKRPAPRGRLATRTSTWRWHQPVTGGVWVDQVGVNPLHKRLLQGGSSLKIFVDPWPVKTQLAVIRKKHRHPARGSLLPYSATGFGQLRGVLVVPSTAEVDRRHVARVLRWITGRCSGLAGSQARECMSEAGL